MPHERAEIVRLVDGRVTSAVRDATVEGRVLVIATAGSISDALARLSSSAEGAAFLENSDDDYDWVLGIDQVASTWTDTLHSTFASRSRVVADALMVGEIEPVGGARPGLGFGRLVRVIGAGGSKVEAIGEWDSVMTVGSQSPGTMVDRLSKAEAALSDSVVCSSIGLWLDGSPAAASALARSPGIWLSAAPGEPAPQGTPLAPVLQHLGITAPEALIRGSEAEVEVIVSGSPLDETIGFVASTMANLGQPLVVSVIARGGITLVGRSRWELAAQSEDERETIRFAIRADSVGRGQLVVQLEQGADALITLTVPIMLTSGWSSPQKRTTTGYSPLRAVTRHRNRMVVLRDERRLLFVLTTALSGTHKFSHQLPGDLIALLAPIHRQLEQLYQSRADHGPAVDLMLQGIGAEVAAIVAPPKLLELLWHEQATFDQLEIVSDEPAIPWELMRLQSPAGDVLTDRPFLGERGATRTLFGTRPPSELKMRDNYRFSFTAVAQERDQRIKDALQYADRQLAVLHSTRAREAILSSLVSLLEEDDFDLLHFGGHAQGGFTEADPAVLLLDDSRVVDGRYEAGGFSPTILRAIPFTQSQPLVFLNACQSGRLAANLGGFAARFMQAGAGAFVGTQWAVAAGPATEFAERFYEEFLGNERTLAESVAAARQHRSSVWSTSRLAYVVYGDPDAKVVPADSATNSGGWL